MYRYLPAALALLQFGCSPSRLIDNSTIESQEVSGYFFEDTQPNMCILRFNLDSSSKKDVYDILNKNLPNPEEKVNEYFVIRITFDDNYYFDIASTNFCKNYSEDKVVFNLSNSGTSNPKPIGQFQKIPMDKFFEKFPVNELNLDVNNFASTECYSLRKFNRALSFEEIIELRYRYAIPVVYHQWTSDLSVLVFENDCKNADRYADEISGLLAM
jgi:hypothetical protein